MKTKETTIKILFLAIVCALISATMFSMKPPRAVSYAETENCPHEYDDDCDDECNLCGEKRTPKHYFGEWTVVKEATNDEEGLKERTCVRCNVKQQAILQKTAVPEPTTRRKFVPSFLKSEILPTTFPQEWQGRWNRAKPPAIRNRSADYGENRKTGADP